MSLQPWIQQLSQLLPLDSSELEQILAYNSSLPKEEATKHLGDLLGDTPESAAFIAAFNSREGDPNGGATHQADIKNAQAVQPPPSAPADHEKRHHITGTPSDAAPGDSKVGDSALPPAYAPPVFAPPPGPHPGSGLADRRNHTNAVIEAARVRARDEQEMQQALMNLQYEYGIYNSDIEPEHESDYPCSCPIHRYQAMKWRRYGVQDMWSKAVRYPGEHSYNDNINNSIFTRNPYKFQVVSPFGYGFQRQWTYGATVRPNPGYHARSIHQTIDLNNSLNKEAQSNIDGKEPKHSIWNDDAVELAMSKLSMNEKSNGDRKGSVANGKDEKGALRDEKASVRPALNSVASQSSAADQPKSSRLSSFRKSIGIKTSDERFVAKAEKAGTQGKSLRDQIVSEENGRWPDEQWRYIVANYQEKVGMTTMIAELRTRKPTQYLHLLRAGYFEPIPVAWAAQASNPLKFSIEAAAGWRGITPAWRGYEDTAEERLYWVLNHRVGSVGMRMKPDFISEMNMARDRMAKAVEPPPSYFDAQDTCHLQHTSEGYSKQVMPAPFRAYDRPETASDDTMVLLDVSGSMDFDPVRPIYEQYLITRWTRSTQPKNKDVAKAIIRRFTDAMANHDHQSAGYDLTTFSDRASYIGTINHKNLDHMWRGVRLGGGTRVMTGWQKVKELHFQKHSESATYHPIYGWQAGPSTPMLRLLLLLDGEATDMDEFELDLLGLSWAHVTIFLIGVDGCPHHHRHANELQRISDVNHHVSFVDAQGNCPERFVTHELLKRHLGYDISMREFEGMEELPAYTE
ncbi:hypothetical protein LTR78_004624 [Recurvomyces mirabilis]|uniref:VWFA domain-containing protein n=1 Tax=Recurvomyces mirabilis TaxID=574656 RepID=A0AAE0WPJ3_9PEZI|nr:hypothetical protein LTR78_004624 [Recurvomyces mirabilis]KAK5152882.1 hypothetical protein LTS14_007990 [Recurvomyces mirabilis]